MADEWNAGIYKQLTEKLRKKKAELVDLELINDGNIDAQIEKVKEDIETTESNIEVINDVILKLSPQARITIKSGITLPLDAYLGLSQRKETFESNLKQLQTCLEKLINDKKKLSGVTAEDISQRYEEVTKLEEERRILLSLKTPVLCLNCEEPLRWLSYGHPDSHIVIHGCRFGNHCNCNWSWSCQRRSEHSQKRFRED